VNLSFKNFGKEPSIGAQTLIYLASSSDFQTISGEYFEKKTVKIINKETYDLNITKKL